MKRKNLILIGALITGILIGLCYGFVKRHKDKAIITKVGYSPLLINMPIMVAEELHYFDSVGIRVELNEMSSTNNMRDAITNGNIDIAVALGTEMFVQNNIIMKEGLKALFFNVLTINRYVDAIIVKNKSSVNSIEELSGKNIGCYPSSTVQAYLNTIAQKKGILFNIVMVNPAEALQLLEAGRIDALYAMEPALTYAINTNKYKVLETALAVKNIQDNLPVGVWTVNNEFYKRDPKSIKLFHKAIKMSIDFIEQYPDSAKALSAQFFNKDKTEFNNSNYPEWKDGCFYKKGKSFNKFLSFLRQNDIITDSSDHPENIICFDN